MRKNNILYMAAVFSLLLCGCSKEDVYHQNDADNAIGTVLSLQVNAATYRSAAGTRTTDAGITTTFTYGDRLGVIVTHQDGSSEHLVFTYNYSWRSSAPFYYDPRDTYAAYYPYKEDLRDKTLDEIKSTFTPLADQSDYATGYAASDLMTCESAHPNTTEKTLQITLTHAFSMLRMPVTNIPVITNANEYSATATDVAFRIGDTPYRAWVDGEGYARLIVNNSGSNIAVKSYYTVLEKRVESSCKISFASGQYYTVTPQCADLRYQLSDARVGDFYCRSSDGTTGYLIPGDISSLTAEQKKACLGVVMKVGKDNSGDWKDDCEYKFKGSTTTMTTIHGYVLALYDANGGTTCLWGSNGTAVGTDVGASNKENSYSGFANTQKIKVYALNQSLVLKTAFPATYYATEHYESEYPAPRNSSGWFLPSAGQCRGHWSSNLVLLLNQIRIASKNSSYSWKGVYWSSSEDQNLPAEAVYPLGISPYAFWNYKNSYNSVRSVLVF